MASPWSVEIVSLVIYFALVVITNMIILWLKIDKTWMITRPHAEGIPPYFKGWRIKYIRYPKNCQLPNSTARLTLTPGSILLHIPCLLFNRTSTIPQRKQFEDLIILYLAVRSWPRKEKDLASTISMSSPPGPQSEDWGLALTNQKDTP